MSLLRVPTTPSKSNPGQLLLMEPNQTPVGLATDCQQGHLYWADASLKVIRRANYNGSDVRMIISKGYIKLVFMAFSQWSKSAALTYSPAVNIYALLSLVVALWDSTVSKKT